MKKYRVLKNKQIVCIIFQLYFISAHVTPKFSNMTLDPVKNYMTIGVCYIIFNLSKVQLSSSVKLYITIV